MGASVDSARRKDWRKRGLLKAVRGAPRGRVVKFEGLEACAKVRREDTANTGALAVGDRPNGLNLAADAMWRGIDGVAGMRYV
jgi:hypothetical protein